MCMFAPKSVGKHWWQLWQWRRGPCVVEIKDSLPSMFEAWERWRYSDGLWNMETCYQAKDMASCPKCASSQLQEPHTKMERVVVYVYDPDNYEADKDGEIKAGSYYRVTTKGSVGGVELSYQWWHI